MAGLMESKGREFCWSKWNSVGFDGDRTGLMGIGWGLRMLL